MRAATPQRARQLRAYRPLADEYLAAHPLCESPWPCGQRATQVHHRMGRNGWRLTAVEWFAASCTDCNVECESDGRMRAEAGDTHWKVPPSFTGDPGDAPIIPVADLAAEVTA